MLDPLIRNRVDSILHPLVRQITRVSISANMITFAGFALIPIIVGLITVGSFNAALMLIILNRLLDGLDGMVARHYGATDFGGYLDIVVDFLFYASIPVGFVFYNPTLNAVAGSFVLLSFIGTGSSFLAYAILAEKYQIKTSARGEKSFFHLGGLIEGSETILYLITICLLPSLFSVLSFGFAGLCFISTAGRVYVSWRQFGP